MLYCYCPSYFSTLSLKVQDFVKRYILKIKYVFLVHLQFLSESFLVIRRIQRCYHCTKLVFTYSTGSSVIFEWKLDFLHKFRKNFQQSNPWKSVQWKPYCSINSDTTKLTVTFRSCEKGPKIFNGTEMICLYIVLHLRLSETDHFRIELCWQLRKRGIW